MKSSERVHVSQRINTGDTMIMKSTTFHLAEVASQHQVDRPFLK